MLREPCERYLSVYDHLRKKLPPNEPIHNMSALEWANWLLSNSAASHSFLYRGTAEALKHHRVSWQQAAYVGAGTRIACLPIRGRRHTTLRQGVQRILDDELPGCSLSASIAELTSTGELSVGSSDHAPRSEDAEVCEHVERLYPHDAKLWRRHCGSANLEPEVRPAQARVLARNSSLNGNGSCLVFHAQHKSAGNTFVRVLRGFPPRASGLEASAWTACKRCQYRCDANNWDYSASTCSDIADFPNVSATVPMRVLTHGLATSLAHSAAWSVRAGCLWATAFRDPVARLVSALHYCRQQARTRPLDNVDPLCAATHLDARNATLREWAAHWSDYLFLELLQHPALRAEVGRNAPTSQNPQGAHVDPPWFDLKRWLRSWETKEARQSSLAAVLQRLDGTDGDTPLFGIFGLVERWNETCALFDHAIPLHGTTWLAASAEAENTHGSEAWKAEELATLREARSDPVVLSHLATDLAIYAHAQSLFDAQLQRASNTSAGPSLPALAASSGIENGTRTAAEESPTGDSPLSQIATIIAMDLRTTSTNESEFFQTFNAYTAGTDVYVCTDRAYEREVDLIANKILVAYAEDDGGIPPALLHPKMARLIQWWRLRQCFTRLSRHSAARKHTYSFIFKVCPSHLPLLL